jgi:hypothetical protein
MPWAPLLVGTHSVKQGDPYPHYCLVCLLTGWSLGWVSNCPTNVCVWHQTSCGCCYMVMSRPCWLHPNSNYRSCWVACRFSAQPYCMEANVAVVVFGRRAHKPGTQVPAQGRVYNGEQVQLVQSLAPEECVSRGHRCFGFNEGLILSWPQSYVGYAGQ